MKKNIHFYLLLSASFAVFSLYSAAGTVTLDELNERLRTVEAKLADIEKKIEPQTRFAAAAGQKPVAIKPRLPDNHPLRNLPKKGGNG